MHINYAAGLPFASLLAVERVVQGGPEPRNMTHDVFLSYTSEDVRHAARLAQSLEASGLTVWWDRSAVPATSLHARIQTELDAARCVVAIWSRESARTAEDPVHDEAGKARARGLLVQVLVEKTRLPPGFRNMEAVDLVDWKGSPKNVFFQDLVAAIRAKLQSAPPPRPRGPLHRLARNLIAGTLSAGTLLTAFSFVADAFSVQEGVCSLPVVQPWLSDRCGDLGLGGKPKRDERIAWETLPAGSCQALRDFGIAFPNGAYQARAAQRVDLRTVRQTETWQSSKRELPLVVTPDGEGQSTEALARELSLATGQRDADRQCRGFSATTIYRLERAFPRADEWNCRRYSSGHVCGFTGWAVCEVKVQTLIDVETCGGAVQ